MTGLHPYLIGNLVMYMEQCYVNKIKSIGSSSWVIKGLALDSSHLCTCVLLFTSPIEKPHNTKKCIIQEYQLAVYDD